jgi:hypothetical protein
MHDTILKISELQLGNVVKYCGAMQPNGIVRYCGASKFGDMMVVMVQSDGVYLRRPYIDETTGKAEYEEIYCKKDDGLLFMLA